MSEIVDAIVDAELSLSQYRVACQRLRVDVEESEAARRKLEKENEELRAGLLQANQLIATNLELTHKLAEALTKTGAALEDAMRGNRILAAFIEYQTQQVKA